MPFCSDAGKRFANFSSRHGDTRRSSMPKRIALISDHASPLTAAGGVDSGGQNVYVAETARQLAAVGHSVDIFTRSDHHELPPVVDWQNGRFMRSASYAGNTKAVPTSFQTSAWRSRRTSCARQTASLRNARRTAQTS